MAGTFYFCESFCNLKIDGIEYFDVDDLRALVKDGHEVGCHTSSHIRLTQKRNADIIADIKKNASFVNDVLGEYYISTFAYPFGDTSIRTKLLMQNLFAACRSTFCGVNKKSVDLAALRAERLYSARIDSLKLRALLRDTATQNGWLNLYTHDVAENPTQFGCTPTLLQGAIDTALQEGCEILTVKNALGAIAFRS